MNYIKFIEDYLGRDITTYKNITSGRDFNVFIVEDFIFRFPKNDQKISILIEEKRKIDVISPYIHSTKIPKFEIIDNCMICSLIPGNELPDSVEYYTPTVKRTLISFLKELHTIDEKLIYPQDNSSKKDTSKEGLISFVNGLTDSLSSKLKKVASKNELRIIEDYLYELFVTFESSNRGFIHSDFQGTNILYDKKSTEITGVIDFTNSRIGNLEADFTNFYCIDDKLLREMIELYLGKFNEKFYDNTVFISKRGILFEIDHDQKEVTLDDHKTIKSLRYFDFIK